MIAVLSVVAIALTFACAVSAQEGTAPAKPKATPKPPSASGEITAVDAKAGTLSIKNKDGVLNFTIAKDCKISTADKPDATVSDLKVGDKVRVVYSEEAGAKVAQKIGLPKTPKPKGGAK
jgi:Cu/Ag efflux protein CusF